MRHTEKCSEGTRSAAAHPARQSASSASARRRLLVAGGLGACASLAAPVRALELALQAEDLPPFHADWRDALRRPRAGWQTALGSADPARWREQALARARALMLPAGHAALGPVTATVLDTQRSPQGQAQRLRLALATGREASALMLSPAGPGPFPAVLLLHDHGALFDIGKEKMIRPWDDEARAAAAQTWVARYYGGRFLGQAMQQRGYVVLAIDALGWGERSRPGFGRDQQQALAANLMNLGSSWASLIAADDLRALDWLRGHPEVDAARVAALGFSMGGFRAWQLAALAPELRACVATHWMCTREAMMRPGGHTLQGQSAYAMLHPGLARELDHPDIAALIAPRALLMHAGAEDPLFPLDGSQAALAQLREVWAAWGAPQRLSTRLWPGGHRFEPEQQDAAFDWLDAQLGRAG